MERAIFEEVRTGAETARARMADIALQLGKTIGVLRALPLEQLLGRVGLQRKASPLYGIGLFGAGVACGVVAGALFAPISGKELRTKLSHTLKDAWGSGKEKAKTSYQHGAERVHHGAERIRQAAHLHDDAGSRYAPSNDSGPAS